MVKQEYPLNFEAVMNVITEVESLEKGLEALKDLGKELGFE